MILRDQPDETVEICDQEAAVAMVARIVSDARSRIWIRAHHLEPWLFDHRDVMDALRWVTSSKDDLQVQVLLHDAAAIHACSTRFLELAREHPATILFRTTAETCAETPAGLVANDIGGYYERPDADSLDGTACVLSRTRILGLSQRFRKAWENAQTLAMDRIHTA